MDASASASSVLPNKTFWIEDVSDDPAVVTFIVSKSDKSASETVGVTE